jgi:hypothetical protein
VFKVPPVEMRNTLVVVNARHMCGTQASARHTPVGAWRLALWLPPALTTALTACFATGLLLNSTAQQQGTCCLNMGCCDVPGSETMDAPCRQCMSDRHYPPKFTIMACPMSQYRAGATHLLCIACTCAANQLHLGWHWPHSTRGAPDEGQGAV